MNRPQIKTYARKIGPNKLHVDVAQPAFRSQKYPMLFVHGAFDGSWIYRFPMRMLAGSGRTVYALNLRGYSWSKWKDIGNLTIEDYLSDIHTVRKALKLDKFVLAGYSSGGVLALKYAERYGTNALILYDPSIPREVSDAIGERRNLAEKVQRVVNFWPDEAIISEMYGRRIRGAEYQNLLEPFKYSFMSGQVWKKIEHERVSVNFSRIRCPALLLDVEPKSRAMAELARRLNASRFSFSGCSHGSILVGPGAVPTTRTVIRWFREKTPGGQRKIISVKGKR